MCWWVRLYFPGNRISYYRYGYSFMKKKIIAILVVLLLFIVAYRFASYYRLAQVVGVAVQKYVDVLDAESTDPQCTLEHCPNSSKSLPGMPEDRALFTSNERFNMEVKGPATTTEFAIKQVTTKCYFPEDARPYGSATDLLLITLAPSTIKGEYVVIEDKRIGDTEDPLPPHARTLYKGKNKGDPPCSRRSKAS